MVRPNIEDGVPREFVLPPGAEDCTDEKERPDAVDRVRVRCNAGPPREARIRFLLVEQRLALRPLDHQAHPIHEVIGEVGAVWGIDDGAGYRLGPYFVALAEDQIDPSIAHQFIAVLLILQEGRGVQVILVNEKNHRGVLHFTNDFKPPFDVERDRNAQPGKVLLLHRSPP